MKRILIERGNEFKVYENDIGREEDIFGEIYERARVLERQLVSYGKRMGADGEPESGGYPEYLNNIIAFCGERGQGKSTAMQNFIRQLREDMPEDGVKDGPGQAGMEKEILEVIDPTAMEKTHDIVDIIVSRLFTQYQLDKERMDKERQLRFIKEFQKIHRSMSVLKNSGKFIEKEYAYNSSVQNLADIADSMNLKKDIRVLVQDYLNYKGKGMLVIPIDDLDLNLRDAYQVTEQLRKYFVLPEIMIVMAVNIGQLTLCVEQELLQEIQGLRDSERWNIGQEARKMSNKYLEKLIPLSRRLVLPDVRAIAESGENAVVIQYRDSEENGQQVLVDTRDLGIEKGVLQLICDRTGLVLLTKPGEIHPLVPHTLRELVNLISLLGDMGTNKKENLDVFEQYFCDVWLENNLPDAYAAFIRKLRDTQLGAMQQDAFLFLCGMMEPETLKNGGISWGREEELRGEVVDIRDQMRRGLKRLTNGDLINCMRLVQQGRESEVSRLVMAVGIIFSIRMLKLRESQADDILYDFIGGNVFGAYRLIRENVNGTMRTDFIYPVRVFIEERCGAVEGGFSVSGVKAAAGRGKAAEDLPQYLWWMGMTSDFKDARNQSRVMVSENNQIAGSAMFHLEYLLTAGISPARIRERISEAKWDFSREMWEQEREAVCLRVPALWKTIVCNMEMVMQLGAFLEEHNNLRDRAEEKDYYFYFFRMMNQWLAEQNRYLQQEAWERELSEDGPFGRDYISRLAEQMIWMRNAGVQGESMGKSESERTDRREEAAPEAAEAETEAVEHASDSGSILIRTIDDEIARIQATDEEETIVKISEEETAEMQMMEDSDSTQKTKNLTPANSSWKIDTLIEKINILTDEISAHQKEQKNSSKEQEDSQQKNGEHMLGVLRAMKELAQRRKNSGEQNIGEDLRNIYNEVWKMWNKNLKNG